MTEVFSDPAKALAAILDEACAVFADTRFFEGMARLTADLAEVRRHVGVELWEKLAQTVCATHALQDIVHQDPFTARAYHKPRGYAGDAVMLDYMYQAGTVIPPLTTAIGQAIFRYTTNAAPPRAVRARRFVLAEMIDYLAARVHKPAVLALAAGHLREADLSQALRNGFVGPYIALDQDAQSLAVVEQSYGHLGVTSLHMTVRDLLTNSSAALVDEQFDLVYAAGLFDYLTEPVAQRLVVRMWELLRPGGQIVIANFLPDLLDSAYMEGFMGWHLIYRTPEELRRCCSLLPEHSTACLHTFTDREAQIVFLQASKKRICK